MATVANKTRIITVGLGICIVAIALFAYSQISILQANANALYRDNELLQDQLDEFELQNEELQLQKTALQSQIAELQDQILSLQAEVDALSEEKAALKSQIDELIQDLSELMQYTMKLNCGTLVSSGNGQAKITILTE